MANCKDMQVGDVYVCKLCGLALKVEKTCTCGEGSTACTVPLSCCGQEMAKE